MVCRMSDSPKARDTYSDAIAEANRYTNWIVSQFTPYLGASTVEIGIGHGSYIDRLADGRRYAGLDIDPEAVAEAQRKYPSHTFICADLSDAQFAQRVKDRFDSVVCCNVLEHIAEDQPAVQSLAQLLTRDGHLLLFVPALPALYGDLDRLAGHYRRYTRQALVTLMDRAQLEILELRYFNPLGGVGWWLNRALRHQSLNATAVNTQIRTFDKWGVPISRMLDPLCRRVFGQSLLCIARRS